jgi:hypothetical protein
MEVSDLNHTPAALSLGKSPRYPLDRRLDGIQSLPGLGDEKKKSLSSPYPECNPGRPTRSIVTILIQPLLVIGLFIILF